MGSLAHLLPHFWRDLKARKLRSALTLFGIAWGTAALSLLMAFGAGMEAHSRKAMHGMGGGIVIAWPMRTSIPFRGLPKGRRLRLRDADILALKAEIPALEEASPEYIESVRIAGEGKTRLIRVSGVHPSFGMLRNLHPEAGGRFLNARDLEERRRMLFLGDELKQQLFGDAEAVGRPVTLNQVPFRVVGVLREKVQTSNYADADQRMAYLPSTTFLAVFGDRFVDNFVYRARDAKETPSVNRGVYEVLGRRHRFDPGDAQALGLWDTTDTDKLLFYFFSGFNLLMAVSGGCTLAVGGIGVANILYIIVKERTREIGLRMAVGAREGDIRLQFLAQAVLMVGLGGLLGFLLSWGLTTLSALSPAKTYVGVPHLSPFVALTTAAVLGLVGALAGWFPARRASRMDPVQALAS